MHRQFWKILGTVHTQQEVLVQAVAECIDPEQPVQAGGAGRLARGPDSNCWQQLPANQQRSEQQDVECCGSHHGCYTHPGPHQWAAVLSHGYMERVGTLMQLQYICNTSPLACSLAGSWWSAVTPLFHDWTRVSGWFGHYRVCQLVGPGSMLHRGFELPMWRGADQVQRAWLARSARLPSCTVHKPRNR